MDKKELDSARLQELSLLCQDDGWLLALIQDTEDHHMLTAPSHLETDTIERLEKLQRPKRIQLITYSMRVSLAAAGAILILFTAPLLLERSAFPTAYRKPPAAEMEWQRNSVRKPDIGRQLHGAEAANRLNFRLYQLSDSIYNFSNELFTGR